MHKTRSGLVALFVSSVVFSRAFLLPRSTTPCDGKVARAALRASSAFEGQPPRSVRDSEVSSSVLLLGCTFVLAGCRPLHRRRRARAMLGATTVGDVVSPFQEKATPVFENVELSLSEENVQMVLDDVRPYLQGDGGDCRIAGIDGTVVKLELQGACSSCSASAVTLKMGIERTLKQRIPMISEVVAVLPNQEKLTEGGVEKVLESIRPFLSVGGGSIEIAGVREEDSPLVSVKMSGPPLKSMAIKVEIVNRLKSKFPGVEVEFSA
uniref:NIF system FeS cluster assembly NifU C-terminal domain-containing protein n=1 Tax=Noctiluca scintillans TaxID=2966 RepID=A0A7S1A460_NOCSC|mmetsp:Transcript_30908/g.82033  ORF Transcript_30908/g.82033 Transcript_30908/m.82033 type:complete len:266 (+) Transcript_30908:89-886(+)